MIPRLASKGGLKLEGCIFPDSNRGMRVIIYLDDMLVVCNSQEVLIDSTSDQEIHLLGYPISIANMKISLPVEMSKKQHICGKRLQLQYIITNLFPVLNQCISGFFCWVRLPAENRGSW